MKASIGQHTRIVHFTLLKISVNWQETKRIHIQNLYSGTSVLTDHDTLSLSGVNVIFQCYYNGEWK